ncbi:hypothetical protein FSHL1_007246 [Fusarium sambucinum]
MSGNTPNTPNTPQMFRPDSGASQRPSGTPVTVNTGAPNNMYGVGGPYVRYPIGTNDQSSPTRNYQAQAFNGWIPLGVPHSTTAYDHQPQTQFSMPGSSMGGQARLNPTAATFNHDVYTPFPPMGMMQNPHPVQNDHLMQNHYPMHDSHLMQNHYPMHDSHLMQNHYPVQNHHVMQNHYPMHNSHLVQNDHLMQNHYPMHDSHLMQNHYPMQNPHLMQNPHPMHNPHLMRNPQMAQMGMMPNPLMGMQQSSLPERVAPKPKRGRPSKPGNAASKRLKKSVNNSAAAKLANRLEDVARGVTLPLDVAKDVDMTPRPQPKHSATDFLNNRGQYPIVSRDAHKNEEVDNALIDHFVKELRDEKEAKQAKQAKNTTPTGQVNIKKQRNPTTANAFKTGATDAFTTGGEVSDLFNIARLASEPNQTAAASLDNSLIDPALAAMEQPLAATVEEDPNEEFKSVYDALTEFLALGKCSGSPDEPSDSDKASLFGESPSDPAGYASSDPTATPSDMAGSDDHLGEFDNYLNNNGDVSSFFSGYVPNWDEPYPDMPQANSTGTTITTTATTTAVTESTTGAQKRKASDDDIAGANKKTRTES